MYIIIPLVTGILIGWGSSLKIGTGRREELIMNAVVGSVGAYLGTWALTAIYDPADPGSLSVSAIAASILGAATALVVVDRVRDA
jgi:uncharacterized membrane protein YeaQ/YmgE (transglycosylase-associated protein family)